MLYNMCEIYELDGSIFVYVWR